MFNNIGAQNAQLHDMLIYFCNLVFVMYEYGYDYKVRKY